MLLTAVLPMSVVYSVGGAFFIGLIGGGFATLGLSVAVFLLAARRGTEAFTWRAAAAMLLGGGLAALSLVALLAILGVSG